MNIAARLQTTADPNTIQVSSEFQKVVANEFEFELRGETAIKGIGKRITYFLRAKV